MTTLSKPKINISKTASFALIERNLGFYNYKQSSTRPMLVLGLFLATDVGVHEPTWPSFKDWALADKTRPHSPFSEIIGANATFLKEDDTNNIHITHDIGYDPDEPEYVPATIKMTKPQFIQLLDDWHEKVYKLRPQKVTVIYNNNHYTIETEN